MRKLTVVLMTASLVMPAVWAQGTARTAPKARTVARGVLFGSSGSFLGVGVTDVNADRAKALGLRDEHGVEITSVEADSPASKAGLKDNDVVLEYNGQRVEGQEQFIRMVRETPAGRQAKLTVWRGGSSQVLTATIGQREGVFRGEPMVVEVPRIPEFRMPDMPRVFTSWRSATLGIESESLGSQLAEFFGVKDGVLVRSVTKGSAAEKAGIKAGDVIVKVDDKKVSGPRELSNQLRGTQSKKSFSLTVVRERREMTLSVTLDDEGSYRVRPRVRSAEFRLERLEL
ncbi:MAG: PDZ domain-containing protein [Acidobacteria bacterium]|nr:PDZ domain-containing protein [Acidobacteriota bacterium]